MKSTRSAPPDMALLIVDRCNFLGFEQGGASLKQAVHARCAQRSIRPKFVARP